MAERRGDINPRCQMTYSSEGLKAQIEQLKSQMAELQAEIEQQESIQDPDPEPEAITRKKRTPRTVPNSHWDDVVQMVEQVAVQRWSDCISGLADWRDQEATCTGELVQEELLKFMVINADQTMLYYDQLPQQVLQQNSPDVHQISLLRAYMLTLCSIDGAFNHADILNSLNGLGRLGQRLAFDLFGQDLTSLLSGDRWDASGNMNENRTRREALNLIGRQAENMVSAGILERVDARSSLHFNPALSRSRRACTYAFKVSALGHFPESTNDDATQIPMPF